MPRPKRAKVASNASSARVASSAKTSQPATGRTGTEKTRRVASRAQKPTPAPVEEEMIVARPIAKRPRTAADDDDGREVSALERLKRRRSGPAGGRQSLEAGPDGAHGMRAVSGLQPAAARRNSSPSEVEAPRRQVTMSPSGKVGSGAAVRQWTPPAKQISITDELYGLSPQGEKSQMELQTQIAARRLSQAQPRVPSSMPRAQPTPMLEASMMALKNFKRRTRQPSILRTGRMSMQSATQLDLGSDLEDFNPDDASTPFHSKSATDREAMQSGAVHIPVSDLRRLEDRHLPRSSPPLDSQIEDAISLMKDTIDLTQGRSSSPSTDGPDLPEYIPETVNNTQENHEKDWSDTMAPPKSTSSLQGDEPEAALQVQPARALAGVRAETGVQSPDHRRTVRTRQADKAKAQKPQRLPALSTAQLQSLLPRRLTRRNRRTKPDTFEIPSDSDHDGVERDSSSDDRPQPRGKAHSTTRKSRTTAQPTHTGTRPKNSKTKQPQAADSPLRPLQRGTAKKQHANAPSKKTYGRQSTDADKENNEHSVFDLEHAGDSSEDETLAGRHKGAGSRKKAGMSLSAEQSAEMRAMRDKFAEVDDWEMEFESVEAGGESSSWR